MSSGNPASGFSYNSIESPNRSENHPAMESASRVNEKNAPFHGNF